GERRLRYIRSPKTKVRPCRGIVVMSFMRLDLLSSIVEYQCCACKAHARKLSAGKLLEGNDLGRIDLPTVPPAHPAESRPVGWRYFVWRAKLISQLISQRRHERISAAIRARCFGIVWAVKVMSNWESIGYQRLNEFYR